VKNTPPLIRVCIPSRGGALADETELQLVSEMVGEKVGFNSKSCDG
jgi:hypothetical protein